MITIVSSVALDSETNGWDLILHDFTAIFLLKVSIRGFFSKMVLLPFSLRIMLFCEKLFKFVKRLGKSPKSFI